VVKGFFTTLLELAPAPLTAPVFIKNGSVAVVAVAVYNVVIVYIHCCFRAHEYLGDLAIPIA
jgi:hypothetical protein